MEFTDLAAFETKIVTRHGGTTMMRCDLLDDFCKFTHNNNKINNINIS